VHQAIAAAAAAGDVLIVCTGDIGAGREFGYSGIAAPALMSPETTTRHM